jgi:Fe2+ transport system protein FeoA
MNPVAETISVNDSARILMLKELVPGECGIIHSMALSAEDYTRLAGLGLCPGRRVEVIQSGERMIVRSGSTSIGLHSALATAVRVH